ncbi:MAG: hypothetical protein KIT73_06550 [Burkholderiales bacterium]|nr:hypothetical protein [Burkholderiales bacterium]
MGKTAPQIAARTVNTIDKREDGVAGIRNGRRARGVHEVVIEVLPETCDGIHATPVFGGCTVPPRAAAPSSPRFNWRPMPSRIPRFVDTDVAA